MIEVYVFWALLVSVFIFGFCLGCRQTEKHMWNYVRSAQEGITKFKFDD